MPPAAPRPCSWVFKHAAPEQLAPAAGSILDGLLQLLDEGECLCSEPVTNDAAVRCCATPVVSCSRGCVCQPGRIVMQLLGVRQGDDGECFSA